MNNRLTKLTRKLSFLIVMLSFSAFAKAQEGGYVMGQILDEAGQPLEFATIKVLSKADSSLITGVSSGEDGNYVLEKVPFGDYLLKTTFFGYTAIYDELSLSAESPFARKEPVKMSISEELAEVQIEHEVKVFETKIDKKIYNVDKDLNSKGGNGLDVLRNVPSLDVDANDVITLRGDENVNIFIDGRPSSMPASVLLKQLPASAIEKVEIVTNPSAKYDPEGMSGIINIVLKKNKTQGFNANVNVSMGRGKTNKYNGSLMLSYKNDKFNVTSNLNYFTGPFWWGGDGGRTFDYEGSEQSLNNEDEGQFHSNSVFGKVGVDYFANEKNTLYLNGSLNQNLGWQTGFNNYENFNEGIYTGSSTRNTFGDSPRQGYEINGGWQTQFDTPEHTFDLDAQYSSNVEDKHQRYWEKFYDVNGTYNGTPALQNLNTLSDRQVLLIKGDYVKPFNDSTSLEAGIHSTTRLTGSDIYSENLDWSTNQFVPDTNMNNEFQYNQQVFAAYTTFGQQRGKFGYKLGVRVEQTNTDSELITTQEKFTNDYFSIFPSGHLSYKLKQVNEFQLSYSRRINRPDLGVLNPFAVMNDRYTVQRGNPFLKPEFVDVFELSYLRTSKKYTLNATTYYRKINDMMRRFLTNEGELASVSYVNLSSSTLTGAELITGYTPNKWLRATLTLNYWNSTVNDTTTGNEDFNTDGWSANAAVSFRFKKGWSFQFNGRYNGEMQVTQGVILPMYGMDLSASKQILKQKGSISVRASDIFGTRRFAFISEDVPGIQFTTNRYWESQTVYVTFNYFFGKFMQGKQKRRSKSGDNSDDLDLPDMR